eukprot:883761-Prorocentrum_minimum.AAC.1
MSRKRSTAPAAPLPIRFVSATITPPIPPQRYGTPIPHTQTSATRPWKYLEVKNYRFASLFKRTCFTFQRTGKSVKALTDTLQDRLSEISLAGDDALQDSRTQRGQSPGHDKRTAKGSRVQ